MWSGLDAGMIPRSLLSLSRRAHRLLAPTAVAAMLLAGCSGGSSDAASTGTTTAESTATAASTATTTTTATTTDASADVEALTSGDTSDLGAVGTLSSNEVHDIAVEFDQAEFEAMVETYTSTGEKEWITATVTIDGTTYENVGLRLKGNSSLRGVTTSDDPATIPWLVKLDEFAEGQNHEGLEEFVVRSSSSESALNEAVALELLDLAGLASQDAIAVRFSVNGSDAVLRLVIDSPDGEWMAEEFSDTGALYKAESTGDWSYRGDDSGSYDDVFDQEAGVFADPAKVHRIDHDGEWFRCQGPLHVPPGPQGRPLLIQAGSSTRGIEFCARHAEVHFALPGAADDLDGVAAHRDALEAALVAAGRDPSEVKVAPRPPPGGVGGQRRARLRHQPVPSRRDPAAAGPPDRHRGRGPRGRLTGHGGRSAGGPGRGRAG